MSSLDSRTAESRSYTARMTSEEGIGRRRRESREILHELQQLEGELPDRLRRLVRLNHSLLELLALRYFKRAIDSGETTIAREALQEIERAVESRGDEDGTD